MKTDTSIKRQKRKGAILRQGSPRDLLRRTGWYLLAVVLLASAGAPKAQSQTTSYDEDAKRLAALAEWVSGAWSFIGGVRTAVQFLTGTADQRQLTLEDIKGTIDDALVERDDMKLVEGVKAFAANFHDLSLDAKVLGSNAMLTGHLTGQLTNLRMKGVDLFTTIDDILRLPSTSEDDQKQGPKNDRRVIAVMPAYTVLVPLLVSTRKLLGEVEPSLKSAQDQQNSETLAKAQQTLFMAAGAFVLYAYEPEYAPGRIPPNFFYSPVAEDGRWMFKWPLYAYHYRDPYIGGRIYGPAEPFRVYQNIPIVELALDSLESIVKVQPSLVWAKNAVIWDLDTEKFAKFVFGWIIRVRH